MQKRIATVTSLTLVVFMLASPVYAADPLPVIVIPPTGIEAVDSVLAVFTALLTVLGAVYLLLTVIATVLPQTWKIQKAIAKVAADIKGFLEIFRGGSK